MWGFECNLHLLGRMVEHHFREPKPKKDKNGDNVVVQSCDEKSQKKSFSRYCIIPAAMIVQFCCGGIYAWSVLNGPIDTLMYGRPDANKAPITFAIGIGSFGIAAALFGPWIERKGPRFSTLLGCIFCVSGNYISALALYTRQMWLLFLGYGVICSVGCAVCYISAVSVLQKWYPEKRGMASGLAVGGCAIGGMVVAQVLLPLNRSVGLAITFLILGSVMLVLMGISGLLLKNPPPTDQKEEEKTVEKSTSEEESHQLSPREALTSPNFRLMYLMFFSNSIFCLVVISRLANMTKDIFGKTETQGAAIVSITGLFDLGGRLIFSFVSDWVGRKNCFIGILSIQLIILGNFSVITNTQTYWAFLMAIWILVGCYGAAFGILAAFLSDVFGPKNMASCQGVILTAWSLAGVGGGLIFTAVFDATKDLTHNNDAAYPYNVNVWWILGVTMIGWMALMFITPTEKDKAFIKGVKSVCRIVIRWPTMFNKKNMYDMKMNAVSPDKS